MLFWGNGVFCHKLTRLWYVHVIYNSYILLSNSRIKSRLGFRGSCVSLRTYTNYVYILTFNDRHCAIVCKYIYWVLGMSVCQTTKKSRWIVHQRNLESYIVIHSMSSCYHKHRSDKRVSHCLHPTVLRTVNDENACMAMMEILSLNYN
jgi:hypothetical protein